MLTMIAAVGEGNELGKDNDLVWHLPDDFKRFKSLTTGHYIIMGRKTFDSFPKPLPNRTHLIISRNTNYSPEGGKVVYSLNQAIDEAKADENPYIIGGGQIYKQAMSLADAIELTRVHGSFEADTFFPEIDRSVWKLVNSEFHPKDDKHNYAFTYERYEKIE
ncbi:dihydrofolate reductase [Psychroflexus maritimus]|uniref:Dihydrofolate reductase n=1 Tax=Psychroflexus maritimus TaxID=2714865 RepID=A0A967AJ80_9FLAO|nr:dihydrofolate reductase [Psychroflexus maritimus]NGZ90315.1 dihydrofolate reductase [Psychroflexus maritimus]